MHMRVHANPRLAIAERDDEIGSFPSDTFELKQLIDLIGNFSRIVSRSMYGRSRE